MDLKQMKEELMKTKDLIEERLKEKSLKKKIKNVVVVLFVGIIATSWLSYALGAEEREAMKALEEKKAADLQLEKDKAYALVSEAKVAQEMIDNSNRAKDILIAKGEYSPLTVQAERQPEIAIADNGGIGSWWSKNILRVFIPYEIKYVIDMEKITPLVTKDGLFFEFSEDDFQVIVVPKGYTMMTPDSKEVGVFPKSFKTEDVLALVSSNAKVTAEEFSSNKENLTKAVAETKMMIENIADSCGAKVSFVEKKSTTGATVKIDESVLNKEDY